MKEPRLLGFLLTAAFCCLAVVDTSAVPAPPHPVRRTLPDGTTIMLQMTGDEFFVYTTTLDGYNVVLGEDGFYYYAEDVGGRLASTGVRAADPGRRSAGDKAVLARVLVGAPSWAAEAAKASPKHSGMEEAGMTISQPDKARHMAAMNDGEEFKSLVILVNFKDVKFTTPNAQQAFTNMLNQEGYSINGSTGSARDYFRYSSSNNFNPKFDVVGPIDLPNNFAYYYLNDWRNQTMVEDAVRLVDPTVDFNDYADGNTARGIYVFFAGHAAPNTIWPHKWNIQARRCDGVWVSAYACSGEYELTNPSWMSNIGTFCHEFSHVIGLPDLYDTDYGSNGQSINLQKYSVMANGCDNNYARTPPSLSAMEKYLLGWASYTELETTGEYTLKPVSENQSYMLPTNVDGEYFILETRSASDANGPNVWDAAFEAELSISLPVMMVYHVDRSQNLVYGIPAIDQWWPANKVNAFANHECLKVVRANKNDQRNWSYPGPSNITSLSSESNTEFRAWSGSYLEQSIVNIAASGANMTFTFLASEDDIAVTLDESDIELNIGGTKQLTATVNPPSADAKIEWSSDNTGVATVDAAGLVKGITAGEAVITAKLKGADAGASCNVTVKKSPVMIDAVRQNDLWIKWENTDTDYTGGYLIEILRGTEVETVVATAESWGYVDRLIPETNYRAIVSLDDNGQAGAPIGEIEFSTTKVVDFPGSIGFAKPDGEGRIVLYLQDVAEQFTFVKWSVDGEVLEYPRFAPKGAGRYTVTAEYVTEEWSETITKVITIK